MKALKVPKGPQWVDKNGFGRFGRHAEVLERFISQSFGKTFGGFWEGSKRFCWK